MNGYRFAQQYYKRLADGESINTVNREALLDGSPNLDNIMKPLLFWGQGIDYKWAPKTITVTIPSPMAERPMLGQDYYIQDKCHEWNNDNFDKRVFKEGPIWATREDRDEAMLILKGGKSEA